MHKSINSISSSIYIQRIPGQCNIPGNELANKAAKKATTIATNTILPVSLSSSLQVITNKICDNPPTHDRVTQIYQHWKTSGDSRQIKNYRTTCCLLDDDLVTILLYIIIFIHVIQF